MKFTYSLLISSIVLNGCISMPEKQAAKTDEALPLPERYSATHDFDQPLVDSLLDLFDDPQLSTLTEQALKNNPDLLATLAQMEEAGFNFQKAKGGLWPTFGASGSASRADGGQNSRATRNYSASLDVSWEVDIWGELRHSARASGFEWAASQANYEASRQSLAAQTMQSWFKLIAASKQLELSARERDSLAATHALVERRYERGTATRTEVELAHTDAANARADYQTSLKERDQSARELQALLGSYPDAQIDAGLEWPQLVRNVPSGLPSELLLNRPDIAASYQAIQAADARSQVAYADLFPSFTLTASGGRSSDTLADLGRSAFDAWSLAAQVAAPIFEGGQRRAEVGAAGKRAEQAYQNYRSVVINAFNEVEAALEAESYLAREEAARVEALAASRRAVTKSQRDYESGLIDLLDLLEAQRRVFSTEAQTISIRADRLANRVSLALALGTGV